MKAFKHSGDLGDIVYSLPVIKSMGGGILLLDPTGGEDDPWCRDQCAGGKTKFNKDSFEFIKPLIEAQDYIDSCREWKPGDNVDVNLNEFRSKFSDPNTRSKTNNLIDLHMDCFGLPEWDYNRGWLQATSSTHHDRKVIVCRSPRYQTNYSWFLINRHLFENNAFFMGLDKEHELFEWTFEISIPHVKVYNALDMLNYIRGCGTFIGNPSFPLSLAVGLGDVKVVQELDRRVPTTLFEGKESMQYV